MNSATKTGIVLTTMAAAMGVIAGLLVVTFDFSQQRTSLLIILAIVGVIDSILLYAAYKKERIGQGRSFVYL